MCVIKSTAKLMYAIVFPLKIQDILRFWVFLCCSIYWGLPWNNEVIIIVLYSKYCFPEWAPTKTLVLVTCNNNNTKLPINVYVRYTTLKCTWLFFQCIYDNTIIYSSVFTSRWQSESYQGCLAWRQIRKQLI